MNRKSFTVDDHLLDKGAIIRSMGVLSNLWKPVAHLSMSLVKMGLPLKERGATLQLLSPRHIPWMGSLFYSGIYKILAFARHKFTQSSFSATSFV
jgi:hypothetical protein